MRPTRSSISSTRSRAGPWCRRATVQDLAAGAAGVLRGGVEQDADLAAGVGQVGDTGRRRWWPTRTSAGSGRPRRAWWWTCRRRWARGSRSPGRPGGEGDVVDGGEAAVARVSESTVIMGSSLVAGPPARIGPAAGLVSTRKEEPAPAPGLSGQTPSVVISFGYLAPLRPATAAGGAAAVARGRRADRGRPRSAVSVRSWWAQAILAR